MRASVVISAVSGLLILYCIMLYLRLSTAVDGSEQIKLLLLISIALGIHATQHSTDELHYDFNPLAGKMDFTRDDPVRM